MKLVSIDPGVRSCGVALWGHDDQLISAGLAWSVYPLEEGANAWVAMVIGVERWIYTVPSTLPVEIAIEFPRIYPAAHQKGDQNDLLELAAVVGGIVARLGLCGTRERVYPRDWKGTIDADDMITRVQQRITPAEYGRVELPAKSLQHNVWDAVGIGLHRLGRLAPRRIYPR